MQYRKLCVIGGQGSERGRFSHALRGLAVDSADWLYAVGDSQLCEFALSGELRRSWAIGWPGYSIAVAADGTIYVGQEDQVQVFDPAGALRDTWSDPGHLGLVSAIGFAGDDVLIADTQDRCIRRYDRSGKFRNEVGKDNRMRGFVVPNRHLDFAVDREGILHVCNPGMHRVERYTADGKRLGHFGRFDSQDPVGFPGCCNPTNIALTADDDLIVTEKAGPRIKRYGPLGQLLAVWGTDDFDLSCKNMDVAVDSHGRIFVIDTVRLHIVVYEPEGAAASNPASDPAAREVRP